MCDWTNLEEIMQDLSVAQGFEVPALLETFDTEGPPPFRVEEQECAEQSYYASEAGGGGDFAAPELKVIREMLVMVKEKQDQQPKSPADSRDVDPHTPNVIPPRMLKKINKNVALTSILTAKDAKLSPTRPIPNSMIPLMFKKKSLNNSPQHNMEETNKNASPSQTSSTEQCKQYTPSTHAREYYTKYLQKIELKEQFAEDIWAMAEHQMKELELRKKQKVEFVDTMESGNEFRPGGAYALLELTLPEHRHLMPGDCIVCIVAAKHGYYI